MKNKFVYSILLAFISIILVSNSVFALSSKSEKIDPLLIDYLHGIEKSEQEETLGISTNQEEENVPVIITYYNQKDINKIIELITKNNGKIKFRYELIDAIAADIPKDLVTPLANDPLIKNVFLDVKVQLIEPNKELDEKIGKLSEKGKITPLLEYSVPTIQAPFVWDHDIDGSGVKVAVLDTGIDKNHPDLQGKVIAERDFTLFDGELDPSDGYGHGTHCAGIIAGSGEASIIYVDTSSTDTSELSNLPSNWAMDPPFNLQYHVGQDEGYSWGYFVVGKSAAKIDGIVITDDFYDFPSEWDVTSTSSGVTITYPGHTMNILGGGSEITQLIIDGEVKTGNDIITWGDTTVSYSVGIGGFVKIVMNDYNLVYLDVGDFAPPLAIGFVNTSVSDIYWRYYWFIVDIDPEGDYVRYGFNFDYYDDNEVDVFKGVAPGAQLLNGKVLSDYGWGYESGIIAGIEWAVKSDADVISMSLGGWSNVCDGSDPMSLAVTKASEMGVTVVVAAGNSGWWGDETIGTPACAKDIITVGASTKYIDYLTIAGFSSRGPTSDGRIKPEVLAPGVGIISARAEGTYMGYEYSKHYTSASGTSMATPHVAGAVALLKEIDSSLTPSETRKILMNSAKDLKRRVFSQGAGIIDLSEAYDLAANSKILADPEKINILLEDGTSKSVHLDTSLSSPTFSATRDDETESRTQTFFGVVNPSVGFNYTFNLIDDVSSFTIMIEWTDKSNDVDMELYDPNGNYAGGSYWGSRNYEMITVNSPMNGVWTLVVYPFYVKEDVFVNGTLILDEFLEFDWITYNSATKNIIFSPDVSESKLYSGRLKLTKGSKSVMIPIALMVSKPIEFRSYSYHEYIDNPCSQGGAGGGGGEGTTTVPSGGGGGGGASGGGSYNRFASFDGYFCDELERRGYSFNIPENIPYFNIFLYWEPYDYSSDVRMFLYDPNGNVYDYSDHWGEYEYIYVFDPVPGKWTVVVESESLYSDYIQFHGDVSYSIFSISPSYLYLYLQPGETVERGINITNFIDYDLDVNVEKNIWNESGIEIIPESPVDEDESLGPFAYSYRYYKFEVPESAISGQKFLKVSVSLEDSSSYVSNLFAYVFDANGSLVDYMYDYWSNSLLGYVFIPDYLSPGNWTLVVVGEGLYEEQYPFEAKVWLMDKDVWDWADVTQPPSYFQGTESFTLTVNAPEDVETGTRYAAIYLSGAWWSTELPRDFYQSLSTVIPVWIQITGPSIETTLDTNKNQYYANENVIGNATLRNLNNYMYQSTSGNLLWQVESEDGLNEISSIDNFEVFGGSEVGVSQSWNTGVFSPGNYTLILIYNYTDYYGKNYLATNSVDFIIMETFGGELSGELSKTSITPKESIDVTANIRNVGNLESDYKVKFDVQFNTSIKSNITKTTELVTPGTIDKVSDTFTSGIFKDPGIYTIQLMLTSKDESILFDNQTFQINSGIYNLDDITIPAGELTSIDASETTETILDIFCSEEAYGSASLTEYTENPKEPNVGVLALEKYVDIEIDEQIKDKMSWAIVKVFYSDEEVSALGIDEASLRMYYYNQSTSSWEVMPDSGVNTDDNYVWGNTTHFSFYGLFGNALPTTTTTVPPTPGGPGGGGGGPGPAVTETAPTTTTIPPVTITTTTPTEVEEEGVEEGVGIPTGRVVMPTGMFVMTTKNVGIIVVTSIAIAGILVVRFKILKKKY